MHSCERKLNLVPENGNLLNTAESHESIANVFANTNVDHVCVKQLSAVDSSVFILYDPLPVILVLNLADDIFPVASDEITSSKITPVE